MTLLEAIDDLYQKVFNYNDYSRIFVTIVALFGALVLLVVVIKLLLVLLRGFRLYVLHQSKCCQLDFVKRYGKWAVITGATDGIGLSIAKELAKRGMSIMVVARNPTKLATVKTQLQAIPNVGEVETIRIDLSDSSLENFARIKRKIDPDVRDIGLLINNAGTFPDRFQRFNRFEMEHLLTIANLNMLAPVHMTRMIMPGMVQRGRGMVVNVSSVVGAVTVPYMSIYSSTKTFVDAFTRQLQVEYSSHPIDIVLLTPGPVTTKIFSAATTWKKKSMINPSPDDYAKTAVNALTARCSSYAGTITHGLIYYWNLCMECIGLLPFIIRFNLKRTAQNFELSPVPKRKKIEPSNA